jgi:hypothetical protein
VDEGGMSFATTRQSLHRVAEHVVSPARVRATGNEIALMVTPGGFGTPPFPDGGGVRVDGAELVVRAADGTERRGLLTSLGAAAELAGVAAEDATLEIEPDAAARLAEFYAFAQRVLETLHAEAGSPSEIHLWPEHFDVAFDAGEVNYGASPGDEHHDEPYLYVGPWTAPEGPLWNATSFAGAELAWPVDEATALAFFRERRDSLVVPRAGA